MMTDVIIVFWESKPAAKPRLAFGRTVLLFTPSLEPAVRLGLKK